MCTIIQYFGDVCIKKFMDLKLELYKHPDGFAQFVKGIEETVKNLGVRMVEETLEEMDGMIRESPKRKQDWHVEHHDKKQLLTTLGNVNFTKTLYAHKSNRTSEGKQEMCYLLDKALGFTENQRMTDEVKAKIYEEAVQSSYRRGGEVISENDIISKEAVKELLHKTKFPPNFEVLKNKKVVDFLYIDADEDHFHLQFQKKKGDLITGYNHRKNNGAITKLVYVYEGIEPEAPGSKRNKLVEPHYFCRGTEQPNQELWKEIYDYLDATYDLDRVKKVYINSDGGTWIKEGMKSIVGAKFVLDEFHLSRYVFRMAEHMLDSAEDVRTEIYRTIRYGNKRSFSELGEKLKSYTKDSAVIARIEGAEKYIIKNWAAARFRLERIRSVIGSSTEGHVYHILSKRMSTDPLGWSRHGGGQMARLIEYHCNGGDMLELAKYQKETPATAAGAEELSRRASGMLKTAKKPMGKEKAEYAKYSEAISASLGMQTKKRLLFYRNHWF